MMDETQLMEAILDAPDEDGPRLRYADWLAAHGQADRAEFIRVQLEMARLDALYDPDAAEDPHADDWQRLSERVHVLGEAHPEWETELPELPGIKWGFGQHFGFSRGFYATVVVKDSGTFVSQLGQVFTLAPVTTVVFEQADDATASTVAQSPHLARLRGLRFAMCHVGDAGVTALANAPLAVGLRFLNLMGCQVGAAGAHALAHSPFLPSTLILNLSGNPLAAADIRLLKSRYAKGLDL